MDTFPIDLRHHLRLKDPRLNRRKRHLLIDIITIAICAVIANADTWKGIALFGRKRKDSLYNCAVRVYREVPTTIRKEYRHDQTHDRRTDSG